MAIERFTKDHEWIRVDGGIGTVGITVHAQGQLGDVVFVDVPEAGRKTQQGEAVAVVEWTREAEEEGPPGFGARFVRLSGEQRELVEGFVRQREPMLLGM